MIKNIERGLMLAIVLLLLWLVYSLATDAPSSTGLPGDPFPAEASPEEGDTAGEDYYDLPGEAAAGDGASAVLRRTDSAMTARRERALADQLERETERYNASDAAPFVVIAGTYRVAREAAAAVARLRRVGFAEAAAAYWGTTERLSVIVDHLGEREAAEALVKQLDRYGIAASVEQQKR